MLGIILLAFSIFFVLVSLVLDDSATGFYGQLYDTAVSTVPESLLAGAIICFAISALMYFFYYQFAKLEEIADCIEEGKDIAELERRNEGSSIFATLLKFGIVIAFIFVSVVLAFLYFHEILNLEDTSLTNLLLAIIAAVMVFITLLLLSIYIKLRNRDLSKKD